MRCVTASKWTSGNTPSLDLHMGRQSTSRLLQTGNIQSYAFMFGLGVTVIIYYVVVK